VVFAADVDRLCAAASTPARRATRLEAPPAHEWKLLAAAVGGLDAHCRKDAVDADPGAVLKPATAAQLGFDAPDAADVKQHTTNRM
jgi:hypothetical protein